MSNISNLILYLVGTDDENAQEGLPFDSEESAQSYADDNPGTEVYSVTATIDFDTIEKV